MTFALPSRRPLLSPAWATNDLWRRARAKPSLDLNFAQTKSLADAISGQNLITFTRASSATYVDSDGVLQTAATNEARFDRNPTTGESLGLLVEESRTNLSLRSREFNDAAWNSAAGARTVTANQIAAPDGTTTADLVTADGTDASHFVSQSFTLSAIPYSFSVFAKAGTNNFLQLRAFSAFGGMWANFNLATGTVGTVGAVSGAAPTSSIQPYLAGTDDSLLLDDYLFTDLFPLTFAEATGGGNGWYRCTMVFTPAAATAGLGAYIVNSDSAIGNQTNTSSTTLYLWGAQLEAGAFPTSYIPTTTAAATRSADVASITGTNFSSWYRQGEGTVFVEATPIATGVYMGHAVALSDGTNDNRMIIRAVNSSSQSISIGVDSAITQWASTYSSQTATATKWALGYVANNIAFARNGETPLTDTSATIPTVNQLRIGVDGGGFSELNGTIRRLTYWPQRLPNSTLQAITQ